jgi:GT2 family glycosyltransferase
VWEKIKFSEDFGFYGQEVNWLDRVKHAGHKLLWCQDVFIWHAGSASVKLAQERGEINELAERRAGRARVNEERGKLK